MKLTATHQLFRPESAKVKTEYWHGARGLIIFGGLNFELSDVLALFGL